MLEASVAYLGLFLSDSFNIDKNQVAFTDVSGIFKRLSERDLPLTPPFIAYSINSISPLSTQVLRSLGSVTNLNRNVAFYYNIIPVKFEVDCACVTSNVKDYFKAIKNYFGLLKNPTFVVSLKDERQDVNISVIDLQPINTPPEGTTGKEFDAGVYYTFEGSFSVISTMTYPRDTKLVRTIEVDWQVKKGEDLETRKYN